MRWWGQTTCVCVQQCVCDFVCLSSTTFGIGVLFFHLGGFLLSLPCEVFHPLQQVGRLCTHPLLLPPRLFDAGSPSLEVFCIPPGRLESTLRGGGKRRGEKIRSQFSVFAAIVVGCWIGLNNKKQQNLFHRIPSPLAPPCPPLPGREAPPGLPPPPFPERQPLFPPPFGEPPPRRGRATHRAVGRAASYADGGVPVIWLRVSWVAGGT